MNLKPNWTTSTREGVTQALRAIEDGSIDAEEFEKLNNFCQFALALMQMEGSKKWARAKLNAELMALTKVKKC